MNYKIISSCSSGNATIIRDIILIDCGVTFKRLEKLHETRRQLEILKSLGAPSIAISRLEEEIEKLSHQEEREQRYKIEYSGDYLERQKENGEMEVDEYNIEVQKKNEWEKKHCKEVSVDDDTER